MKSANSQMNSCQDNTKARNHQYAPVNVQDVCLCSYHLIPAM